MSLEVWKGDPEAGPGRGGRRRVAAESMPAPARPELKAPLAAVSGQALPERITTRSK